MVANKTLVIPAPQIKVAEFEIMGTAPLVMNQFPKKVMRELEEIRTSGKRAKPKTAKKRNFEQEFEEAQHKTADGWVGIPAGAFRSAMISACRLVGFKMTQAKLSVFIKEDGWSTDGTPLVKITHGKPRMDKRIAKFQSTVDITVRAMWDPGWRARVKLQYDADMFGEEDIANLLNRVGLQVGLLEGRPDSKTSAGMGWGTFVIADGGQDA